MKETVLDRPALDEGSWPDLEPRPVSGTYLGQTGTSRLILRVDLTEDSQRLYPPLDLVSGDFFRIWAPGSGNTASLLSSHIPR